MSNPTHNELKEKALVAIEELFSDTSVMAEQTIKSLWELMDDIAMRVESLK